MRAFRKDKEEGRSRIKKLVRDRLKKESLPKKRKRKKKKTFYRTREKGIKVPASPRKPPRVSAHQKKMDFRKRTRRIRRQRPLGTKLLLIRKTKPQSIRKQNQPESIKKKKKKKTAGDDPLHPKQTKAPNPPRTKEKSRRGGDKIAHSAGRKKKKKGNIPKREGSRQT